MAFEWIQPLNAAMNLIRANKNKMSPASFAWSPASFVWNDFMNVHIITIVSVMALGIFIDHHSISVKDQSTQ